MFCFAAKEVCYSRVMLGSPEPAVALLLEANMFSEKQRQAARATSRRKKERFLLQMTEDEFRDSVVRPLLLRRGLADGRDLCGPTEEGKDILFLSQTRIGTWDVYVVQTKKGSLNLSSNVSHNVTQAAVQLRTALNTTVVLLRDHAKKLPAKAILCASGRINMSARRHIQDQLDDPRLEFLDADDLIPWVDDDYPELWFGIDATIQPYLRALKRQIEDVADNLIVGDAIPTMRNLSAVADDMFVPLKVGRTTWRPKRLRGETQVVPHYQEIPAGAILSRREPLILVLGEAGSGKSTLLRRLAYVLCNQSLESGEEPTIPVLLRCADIAEEEGSLVALAADHTRAVANHDQPCFSTEHLRSGKVVLLVDALDEVPDQRLRQRIIDRINSFHQDYPLCRVVLTSRQYAFLGSTFDMAAFVEFKLAQFTHAQAEQILARLHTKRRLPKEACQEILRRLEHVHGVELNPLLITVFAATTDYARRDIPANITELFKKFTEIMLGRWDSTKGLSQQYEARVKDFLLCRLAFEMHRRRVTKLGRDELTLIIASVLTSRGLPLDPEQVATELLERSGLLRCFDQSIEFRHLLLQEFFAGRGIPSADFLDAVAAGDTWWVRPLVFYFGENPGDAAGLRSLMNTLGPRSPRDRFTGAIGLGLALQACYLAEINDKEEIFRWVVGTLAATKDDILASTALAGALPALGFLKYYLYGRDAVACSVLASKYSHIVTEIRQSASSPDDEESRTFWVIVGLIECGLMEQAEEAVREFRPKDRRLLLAIHLGCFLTRELRVATKKQRQTAARISESLAKQVADLRKEVVKELRSELLEVQNDSIVAVEPKGSQTPR
jgi:energy-coupling factor transporter ATP-binding protein EcfA2